MIFYFMYRIRFVNLCVILFVLILGLQYVIILYIINSDNNYFSILYFWKISLLILLLDLKRKLFIKT